MRRRHWNSSTKELRLYHPLVICTDHENIRGQQLAITRRNKKVIAETAESYSRKNMRVFCVSNTLFNEYGGCDEELEKAYAELSGIPELRSYCRQIPADAQLASISHFIKSTVPTELASVKIWAKLGFDQDKVQKAAGISDVLETLAKSLRVVRIIPKLHLTLGAILVYKVVY